MGISPKMKVLAFGLLLLATSVRSDLDFNVLAQNPEALQELGQMVANQIRNGKPSDLAKSVGIEEATALNEIPGANEAKSVVADLVESLAKQQDLIKGVVKAAQDNPDLVEEVQKLVGEIKTTLGQNFPSVLQIQSNASFQLSL